MEEKMKQLTVVALQFLEQYYSTMMTNRASLINFYTQQSQITYGGRLNSGYKEIKQHLESLSFGSIKYLVDDKDVQCGPVPNSIMIFVVGQLQMDSDPPFKFSQTFMICPNSTGGLYVNNDIFRIVT